jgi:hypothetical protein
MKLNTIIFAQLASTVLVSRSVYYLVYIQKRTKSNLHQPQQENPTNRPLLPRRQLQFPNQRHRQHQNQNIQRRIRIHLRQIHRQRINAMRIPAHPRRIHKSLTNRHTLEQIGEEKRNDPRYHEPDNSPVRDAENLAAENAPVEEQHGQLGRPDGEDLRKLPRVQHLEEHDVAGIGDDGDRVVGACEAHVAALVAGCCSYD